MARIVLAVKSVWVWGGGRGVPGDGATRSTHATTKTVSRVSPARDHRMPCVAGGRRPPAVNTRTRLPLSRKGRARWWRANQPTRATPSNIESVLMLRKRTISSCGPRLRVKHRADRQIDAAAGSMRRLVRCGGWFDAAAGSRGNRGRVGWQTQAIKGKHDHLSAWFFCFWANGGARASRQTPPPHTQRTCSVAMFTTTNKLNNSLFRS